MGPAQVSRRLPLAAAAASVLPDLDVIGYCLGTPYGHPFGHRGFTHSLAFGILLGLVAIPFAARLAAAPHMVFFLIALSAISRGILDAMTSGGLGIAFLWLFPTIVSFCHGARSRSHPWKLKAFSPVARFESRSLKSLSFGSRPQSSLASPGATQTSGVGSKRRAARGGEMMKYGLKAQ
ncbi:MAG: metal-dependent hydrolase [Candidatus Binatia bacterium]